MNIIIGIALVGCGMLLGIGVCMFDSRRGIGSRSCYRPLIQPPNLTRPSERS